jgi:hypothetical protein
LEAEVFLFIELFANVIQSVIPMKAPESFESRSERDWIPGRPRPLPGLPGMTTYACFQ